ncbi:hypothetical protein ACFFMN_13875 [Planobispora siamensis]|uniref:Lipoprotein n=1 Tax=Planobispora siamensis TaxID=936338 RepID=A0A8J3SB99_9ACTN|nr:hypothetical protein [Planobispora siamensis]GIH89547.1 hypothetical protein Psi01_01770 [Planobispora siamensis]
MKRFVTGLAVTAAAAAALTVPTAAAAQTAPDPLSALKKQLAAGRGVSYSDVTKGEVDGQREIISRRKGTLQFGRSGIAASDQTGKLNFPEVDDEEAPEGLAGLSKPERVITVKNASYISGGFFGEFLPEDKTWLRVPEPALGLTGMLSQPVNAAEPATLRALLAHAAVKRPGAYSGKITFGELYKVSPWLRATLMGGKPSAKQAKVVINWKLALGANRLPARLTTSYAGAGLGVKGDMTLTSDTRYSGWGAKVSVKAPPADQVARPGDLDEEVDTENIPIPLGR